MACDCGDAHAPSCPAGARAHTDWCEAEADHPHDCATATQLARLRAFAEAVRDEVHCNGLPVVTGGIVGLGEQDRADLEAAHRDDCFHCAAVQALEPPR
jgi:hypothetical protein